MEELDLQNLDDNEAVQLLGLANEGVYNMWKSDGTQDKVVLGFRVSYESQGPDLNRRWAALQAAALGRTLPPWRVRQYLRPALKPSGRKSSTARPLVGQVNRGDA